MASSGSMHCLEHHAVEIILTMLKDNAAAWRFAQCARQGREHTAATSCML